MLPKKKREQLVEERKAAIGKGEKICLKLRGQRLLQLQVFADEESFFIRIDLKNKYNVTLCPRVQGWIPVGNDLNLLIEKFKFKNQLTELDLFLKETVHLEETAQNYW